MTRQSSNSINLYEGYRQLLSHQKNDKSVQRLKLIVPLALLALVLLAVSGVIVYQNIQKSRELKMIQQQIDALGASYAQAQELSGKHEELSNQYGNLTFNRMLFNIYPPLNKPLLEKVRDCAQDGRIFTINAYSYSEENITLVVDASADSVNELPKFVERLRETELFSSVQYTGYTSDRAADYFCTVGCMLGTEPFEDEAEAEGTVTAETQLNPTEEVEPALE